MANKRSEMGRKKKVRGKQLAAKSQFTDGENIPAQLLGELRAANAELHEAREECTLHNEAGRIKQQRFDQATHIFNFFHRRAAQKLKIGELDGLDLDRGIVLRRIAEDT